MSTNVDGAAAGDILGGGLEGRDRTGQRSQTYELAEALLRHLHADGVRGQVRLVLELDEPAWAKYRSEVQRPFRAEPRVTVVPVDGVGMLEFRRAASLPSEPIAMCVEPECRRPLIPQWPEHAAGGHRPDHIAPDGSRWLHVSRSEGA